MYKRQVLIGGINVREIAPEELMKYISFVFQNTKLFKTSLLENIKYGNPDATMEEVERAVDMAQCREIINKLPLGLNTKIGTEGTYLSGGEQQRIVLARAILKNAPDVYKRQHSLLLLYLYYASCLSARKLSNFTVLVRA